MTKEQGPKTDDKGPKTDDEKPSAADAGPPSLGIPSLDEWTAYFNRTCVRRGIPPDSREAMSAFGYYDDHGWAHRDGAPYRDWRRCAVTCVGRYERQLRERGGQIDTDAIRRSYQGREIIVDANDDDF